MIELALGILNFLVSVTAFIVAIITFFRVKDVRSDLDEFTSNVKTRMAKLIQDINNINEIDYNVDVEQNNRINKLEK